jgi:sugar phosphate isomerase/epimerase
MKYPLYLQLFTVRAEMAKDYAGTLKKIAAMGYDGVELSGTNPLPATELKNILNGCGMKAIGAHLKWDVLSNYDALQKEIEYNLEIGSKYIVCVTARFRDLYETQSIAEEMNKIAEHCAHNGLTFCYHNHSAEFIKTGNGYLLEVLLNNTMPLVRSQLDVYWAAYSDVNPIEFLKKHSDRIATLHLRQLESYATKAETDSDKGVLNFKEIIKTAESYHITDFVVEQGRHLISQLTTAEVNCKYIKSL